jgi:hypothetical protein
VKPAKDGPRVGGKRKGFGMSRVTPAETPHLAPESNDSEREHKCFGKRGGGDKEIRPIPMDHSLFSVCVVNDPTVPSSTSKAHCNGRYAASVGNDPCALRERSLLELVPFPKVVSTHASYPYVCVALKYHFQRVSSENRVD